MKPRTAKAKRRAQLAEIKRPPPTELPAPRALVLVRCGVGNQVAEVLAVEDAGLVVRAWRGTSGRWSRRKTIQARDLRGVPADGDPRLEAARAATWEEVLP